jgi:hypothetical protein
MASPGPLLRGGQMEAPNMLTADYLKLISAELERLRILKEYELGVEIRYEDGDPYVHRLDRDTGEK